MTRKELAKLAFDECSSPETGVRQGKVGGFPFWNAESTMFMYAPAFHFTGIRCSNRYIYTAVDGNGKTHTFEADNPCASLYPVWKDIPEGVVHLSVKAIDVDGTDWGIVGSRTFYKHCSFPENTPERVKSYKDAAISGYKYAMNAGFVQHLLKEGTPDPAYDLNSYPSKMISSLVNAMISYSEICPEESKNALKVAQCAADYLLKITPAGDHPLANIPPTYDLSFCPDPVKYGLSGPNWYAANRFCGTVMMIYPITAGNMYLNLYEATGKKKYFNAALKIAKYYKNTQLENGSWYLVRDAKTGKPTTPNFISPMTGGALLFFMKIFEITGNESWKNTADKALKYVMDSMYATYNWEGQFEDSPLSSDFKNLTHYGPLDLAIYFAKYYKDDPEKIEIAKELTRFCEDQFVLWGKPYPWHHHLPDGLDTAQEPYDTKIWHTPAAVEQYTWYVPIDASTAHFAEGFLTLYKATGEELYLAKAKALTDQLTIMQKENGQIPTHWMNTKDAEESFWFNCLFYSLKVLKDMSEFD